MLQRWRERRREEQQRADALLAELREEHDAKAEAGDPVVREAARDFANNDAGPWRVDVRAGALVLGFLVTVIVLVALLGGLEALIGR